MSRWMELFHCAMSVCCFGHTDLTKSGMFSINAIGVSSMSPLEFDSNLFSVFAFPHLISFWTVLCVIAGFFHSQRRCRCLSKNSFVFCVGSSLDHMLFSWLGSLFVTRKTFCGLLPQVILSVSVLLLSLSLCFLFDFAIYWLSWYVHPDFIH